MKNKLLKNLLNFFFCSLIFLPIVNAQKIDTAEYKSLSNLVFDFTIPDSLIHSPLPENTISGMGFEIDGKFFTVWLDGKKVTTESKEFTRIIEAHKEHLGEFANIAAKKEYVLVKLNDKETQLQEQTTLFAFSYMEDVIIPYEGEELFSTLLKREMEKDCIIPKGKNKVDLVFTINDFKIDEVSQKKSIFKKYKNLYENYNRRRIIKGLKIEITLELRKDGTY